VDFLQRQKLIIYLLKKLTAADVADSIIKTQIIYVKSEALQKCS